MFAFLQKPIRKHHVADPDCRGNGFGKRADVNHAVPLICSLQGRNRLSLVTKFTVIVILDNIAPLLFGRPGKQLQAAFDRHYDSQWILVGGHYIGYIHSRALKH